MLEKVKESWVAWSLLEALSKATNRSLSKLIAGYLDTLGQIFYVQFIVSIIRVFATGTYVLKKGESFKVGKKNLIGSFLFGMLALAATFLTLLTFQLGGEIGTSTLILISTSFVVGIIVDRIGFGQKLTSRQWVGVAFGLASGAAIIDPTLSQVGVSSIPWILTSYITGMAVGLNQGVSKMISTTRSVMAVNFWAGLITLSGSLVLLLTFATKGAVLPTIDRELVVGVALIMGLVSTLMWAGNILAYKKRAFVAFKKLLSDGVYLTLAMVAGVFWFNESISAIKIAGLILLLIAIALMMKPERWNEIIKALKNKKGT